MPPSNITGLKKKIKIWRHTEALNLSGFPDVVG